MHSLFVYIFFYTVPKPRHIYLWKVTCFRFHSNKHSYHFFLMIWKFIFARCTIFKTFASITLLCHIITVWCGGRDTASLSVRLACRRMGVRIHVPTDLSCYYMLGNRYVTRVLGDDHYNGCPVSQKVWHAKNPHCSKTMSPEHESKFTALYW